MLSIIALAICIANANAPQSAPSLTTPGNFVRQLDRDRAERQRRDQVQWRRNQTPERRERAARLSAMANDGRCPEAIAIARREGDEEMADRLTAACRSPSAARQ